MSWVGSVDAITLFVNDLEAARDFYCRAFDQSTIFEDDVSATFRFGGIMVNLLQHAAVPELIEPAVLGSNDAGPRSVMTIQVESVDDRAVDLASKGIALLNGPMDRPWGPRTLSFQDPDGHVWELAS
ncbi:MAG: VOC family protein [Acidimicrobiales bacterium]